MHSQTRPNPIGTAFVRRWSLAACLAALVMPALAQAEIIRFPDEELAAESVLPVFDQPESVKNRSVLTSRRVELALSGGYALTEPFANPLGVGASVSYHFNEEHALNLFFDQFLPGVSSYTTQAQSQAATQLARLDEAPRPKYVALASYQYTAFYGKISLSKEAIMNLGLYGLLGAGAVGVGNTVGPGASVGLGQKFYLNSRFALRFDLRYIAYMGPNPLSKPLQAGDVVPPASAYTQEFRDEALLSFGIAYLLPAF